MNLNLKEIKKQNARLSKYFKDLRAFLVELEHYIADIIVAS